MKILAAEYVLPISAEPIAGGAVAIDGKRIAAVGAREDIVSLFPAAPVSDFGSAAILPGFVNCHSHLEVTAMRGALDSVEHDFKSWLLRLNDLRSELSTSDIEAAALLGAREGAAAGVTCFGDIGRTGLAGVNALRTAGLRGIVFQETEFSPDNATADEDFGRLIEKFSELRELSTDLVEVGLSPHSPYTVSRRLFELIARYAVDNGVKITIHAAESDQEDSLLRNGEGFFTDFYTKMNVAWEVPGCSPVEFLSRTGILSAGPLLAHCVRVSDSDIDAIAAAGASVAHCPKSNAKFGHGSAPIERMIDSGVVVGLGSDSVASNNVCDLLEEARFAALCARIRDGRFFTPREMLRMATLGGAEALGLQNKIGSLETGKEADITVVSLESLAQLPVNDIETALVFSSNARDVVMTLVAGREVYEKA